jgi:hypothetical protein
LASSTRSRLFLRSLFLSQRKPNIMQELIDRMKAEGLTEEQAYKAIEVIKNFAKEKFPIFGGAIDKLFDKYNTRDDDDFMP